MKKVLNSWAALSLIAIFFSISANIATIQAAFGTSPPWVKNDKLLPGSTLEETVYLSRSDAQGAVKIDAKITGDEEIKAWTTIENRDSLIMPSGQNLLPMKVTVTVPEDAKLGDYKGGIFVIMGPADDEETLGGGQIAIALGGNISVELTVIDNEINDYRIKSANVAPQEPDEPFAVNVAVSNTGNTPVSEVEGEIDIYEAGGTEAVKTLAFQPLNEPLEFNETRDMEMVFDDYRPAAGDYNVDVKAFKDGEIIYENRVVKQVRTEPIPVISPEDAMAGHGGTAQVVKSPDKTEKTILTPNRLYAVIVLMVVGLSLVIFAVYRIMTVTKGIKLNWGRKNGRKK